MNASKEVRGSTYVSEHTRGTYVCRKLRLYSFLTDCGFKPYRAVPDMYDSSRLVWLYEDSDEIRDAVEEYYKAVR